MVNARAVIFDLDGTLADTLPDLTDAVNYGLAALGLPAATPDQVRSWVGEGLPTLCQRALATFQSPLDAAALIPLVTEHYAAHRLDKSGPFPGIPGLLDELNRRGLPVCVLSNKPHLHTEPMVMAMFAGWRFAAIEGYREESRKKPDPRTAREIADRLGLAPVEILMVGDSATDIRTAVNAGLVPVGATWGYRPREDLVAAGAKHLIDHPADLLKLF